MKYEHRPKLCKKGCREDYRESDEDHQYAYHTTKTVALICGCGYGDIFVSRVRKHLLEAHGIRATKVEVVNNYFWHRVPEYHTVRTCEDPKRIKCVFRTPIHEIIETGHDCRRGMQQTALPRHDKFIDFMQQARVVPVRGVPGHMQQRPLRSPSPKRSIKPSASEGESQTVPQTASATSDVSGRTGSRATSQQRPTASAAAARAISASPERSSEKPSRFESRRKSESDESESEQEFSGSEHSADTRPKGSRKPSSIYDEDEIVLHPEDPSEFEVQLSDETRTVVQRPQSEWWGDVPSKPQKQWTTPTRDMAAKGAIGGQAEPQPSASAAEKPEEKWQEVGPRGKPVPEEKPREKYEPDWDLFDKILVPDIKTNASTYASRANLMREPSSYIMRGKMVYNMCRERTHNVHVYTDGNLYEGTFVLINEEGSPFCYATVTPHVCSPYKLDANNAQFNPLNFPAYAEMSDRRPRPNHLFFYLCISVPVATGKFVMHVIPRDERSSPITITFNKMGEFGRPCHVQYRK